MRALLPICCALLAAGCGVARPSDFQPICPNYEVAIRPLLDAKCGDCHGLGKADGGYVIGEHRATVSRSDDGTPRIAPGDAGSPFLAAVRGERAGHTALEAADVATLEDWVVRCRAAPLPHQFHPPGWATSTDSEQFHGVELRANFYNFSVCQHCHGEDLRGGAAKVDCNSCHGTDGPLGCTTCHGDADSPAPPRDLNGVRLTTSLGVGAHRAHVKDGNAHKGFGCVSCHLDVKKATDEGHYRRNGVFLKGPAEVSLASGPTGQASWDRTTATCTNSACHAPSKDDTASTKVNPVWTRAGKGDIKCGSCHGAPPSSHSDDRCAVCHGAAYSDGGVDLTLHLNGKVDFRGDGQKCDSCHAGPDSPTFVDLQGRAADAGVKTVGAHDAHLHAGHLRGPLACGDCHKVPAKVGDPGHIDHAAPAIVFPAGGTGLAWNQGAAPVYNAANATCGSVYCHGGGVYPTTDTAPTLNRTPSWTGGPTQAACGTCHGFPPKDGTFEHTTAAQTTPCSVCHTGSVYPDAGIIFSSLPDGGLTSKHMDGQITGP